MRLEYHFPPCPVCDGEVKSASHEWNPDIEYAMPDKVVSSIGKWTVRPCGHHPYEYDVRITF